VVSLWLVRHAQPQVAPGTCYGRLDVPAEPDATRAAAKALANTLPAGLHTISSPLQRCTQLAEALCQQRPPAMFDTDTRLAEMDFGAWEGQPWDQISPAALDAWTRNFAHHAPGGGETVTMFMNRVSAALDTVRSGKQDTLWITHAGVMRAVTVLQTLGKATPLRSDQWPREALPFGGWQQWALDPSA
jgi:alpha-ribazole phosphatase